MTTIQKPPGDGNVARKHHRYLEYWGEHVSVQEFETDNGRWIRINNEYDITPEQWAELLRYASSLRRGPKPEIREDVADLLAKAFDMKDTWPVGYLRERLALRGFRNHVTIRAACRSLDIVAVPDYEGGHSGITQWLWTTNEDRVAEYERRKAERRTRRPASRGRSSGRAARS